MSLLEAEVSEIRSVLAKIPFRDLPYEPKVAAPALRNAGLILKESTAVELGSPEERPSCRILLYTNTALPDSIQVLGEAPTELIGKSVSLAQVVILSGKDLPAEVYYQFCQRHQRLLDQPGFMVKTMESRLWIRMAEADGGMPDMKTIGSTLIARTHEAFPQVEGVSVYFILNRDPLVMSLSEFAGKLYASAQGIKEDVWKARGFDWKSCQLAGHCGSCSDKKTCASVRKIEQKVRIKRRNEAEQ